MIVSLDGTIGDMLRTFSCTFLETGIFDALDETIGHHSFGLTDGVENFQLVRYLRSCRFHKFEWTAIESGKFISQNEFAPLSTEPNFHEFSHSHCYIRTLCAVQCTCTRLLCWAAGGEWGRCFMISENGEERTLFTEEFSVGVGVAALFLSWIFLSHDSLFPIFRTVFAGSHVRFTFYRNLHLCAEHKRHPRRGYGKPTL